VNGAQRQVTYDRWIDLFSLFLSISFIIALRMSLPVRFRRSCLDRTPGCRAVGGQTPGASDLILAIGIVRRRGALQLDLRSRPVGCMGGLLGVRRASSTVRGRGRQGERFGWPPSVSRWAR
jgi:hypothetical protein